MYEVELKVRADHDRVSERLDAIGASATGTVTQEDHYYDAPHRTFAETDEALRLRHERDDGSETTRITYKGPLVEQGSKSREEFETAVEDAGTMDSILRKLGFEPAAIVEKRRSRYEYDGYTITLDTVAGLGEFVEIEIEIEAKTVAPARDGAIEILEALGVDPDEQIRTSYLELLLEGDAQQ